MLYSRIANLVPDHAVLFTREAFGMQFRVKSLMDDIDTYAMHLRYGCFQLDGNEFALSELQRKMLDARPKIFTMAADLHNLRLVWTANMSFAWHISRAIEIVSTLQANQQLLSNEIKELKGGAGGNGAAGTGNQSGGKRKGAWPSTDKYQQKKMAKSSKPRDPKGAETKIAEFKALAKQYQRCLKCGTHGPNGDWTAHGENCSKKHEDFTRRMGKVAKMVAEGKADRVNVFGKK